jgi:hypothetical protein
MANLTFRRTKIWTDEQLEALPHDGNNYELLDGALIMSPVPANHGIICVRLIILIGSFVQRPKIGRSL